MGDLDDFDMGDRPKNEILFTFSSGDDEVEIKFNRIDATLEIEAQSEQVGRAIMYSLSDEMPRSRRAGTGKLPVLISNNVPPAVMAALHGESFVACEKVMKCQMVGEGVDEYIAKFSMHEQWPEQLDWKRIVLRAFTEEDWPRGKLNWLPQQVIEKWNEGNDAMPELASALTGTHAGGDSSPFRTAAC
eukprot:gene13174-66854_t